MQRLGSRKDSGEGLGGDPDHIVHWLLAGQGRACGMDVKLVFEGLGIPSPEFIMNDLRP